MDAPGGQLIKQTHKFFGSERQYAGTRGVQIPEIFFKELSEMPNVKMMWGTNAAGYYEDGTLALEDGQRFFKVKPKRVILAQARPRSPCLREQRPAGVGAGAA